MWNEELVRSVALRRDDGNSESRSLQQRKLGRWVGRGMFVTGLEQLDENAVDLNKAPPLCAHRNRRRGLLPAEHLNNLLGLRHCVCKAVELSERSVLDEDEGCNGSIVLEYRTLNIDYRRTGGD